MDGVMTPSPGTRLRPAMCALYARRDAEPPHTYPKISAAKLQARPTPTSCYPYQKPGSDGVLGGQPQQRQIADDKRPSTARVNGKISREALVAWNKRVKSPSSHARGDDVKSLFNDLHLYPSKSEVFEMVCSARDCARRKDFSLTFGEFCVFVAELKRRDRRRTSRTKRDEGASGSSSNSQVSGDEKPSRCESSEHKENGQPPEPPQYEVFLGGSCNPTTWRVDHAIPTLDSMGITYFNPQVKEWSKDLIEIEHRAKQSAHVLFFVLDAETRAAAAAVEAAHLAASTRSQNLVLVLQPYRRGQSIGGELVPDQEYLDLKRGQDILQEVAERRDLLVFDNIESALRCTHRLLRGNEPFYLSKNESQSPTMAKHIVNLKNAFDNADEHKTGSLTMTETSNAIKSLTGMNVSIEDLKSIIDAKNDLKNGINLNIYRSNSSNSLNGSLFNHKIKPATDLVDYEMFYFILAELNAEIINYNNTKILSPHKLKLEQQIKNSLGIECEMSGLKLITKSNSDLGDSSKCLLKHCNITSNEDGIKIDRLSPINVSNNTNDSIQWNAGTGKWRQLLNCFQEAVFGFLSKIELARKLKQNSTEDRSENSNKINADNIKTPIQEESTNDTRNSIYLSKSNESLTSSSSNKSNQRKLSVIIPKVIDEVHSDSKSSVLTPQTDRRLNALAESVRDEITFRDVYLGGACVNQTNWRENVVVPLLKNHNFSYYIPVINDYNRIWSAPPYTPTLSANRFNFDARYDDSKFNKSSSESLILSTLSKKLYSNSRVVDKNLIHNSMTLDHCHSNNARLNVNNIQYGHKVERDRISHKHERSPPIFEDNQPEKRPKYSRDESPGKNKKSENEDVQIELRTKEMQEVGYPLNTSNRLSASDYYKIPEDASPAPFTGMYDERLLRNSRVLFFGVTKDTRCLTPMVLAAHCIGLRPRSVVLCVQLLNQTEDLSEQAVKDYNRGRMYLSDLAKREGVPIFDNLEEATQCVIEKLKNGNY